VVFETNADAVGEDGNFQRENGRMRLKRPMSVCKTHFSSPDITNQFATQTNFNQDDSHQARNEDAGGCRRKVEQTAGDVYDSMYVPTE
jgi:hypothetical protein